MASENFSDVKEITWLVSTEDVNRLRRFAFRNQIGDSAYAIRRVLDLAEEMEQRGHVGEHGRVKQVESSDHEGLVHPVRSAERAAEHLAAGRDKGAIAELAHGLASLGKQHNDLSERVEKLERTPW